MSRWTNVMVGVMCGSLLTALVCVNLMVRLRQRAEIWEQRARLFNSELSDCVNAIPLSPHHSVQP